MPIEVDEATAKDAAASNDTVRAILDAGAACLARLGNEKTSIQDIADVAGLSRATIYRYFADRGQLLQAVTTHDQAKHADEIHRRVGAKASLEEALTIIIEVLAATATRYHTREHLRNRDRGLAQYLYFSGMDRQRSASDLVRPYVERSFASGELQPEVSVDEATEWIALTLTAIPALPGSAWVNLDDPVAVGRTFARLLCRGLAGAPRASRRR